MKWCASLWVNTMLEKHAWLSAGLVWMYGASQSADIGVYRDAPPETPEARPVVSLFEHWEEGARLSKFRKSPLTPDRTNSVNLP